MSDRLEGVAWAAATILGCGALYEVLVALEIVPLGNEPGEAPFGETLVFVAGLLAFAAASGVCVVRGLAGVADHALVWVVLAPVGFLFTLARWYGFDPYYLPTLRRYSTNTVHSSWIVGLGVAALIGGVLGYRAPRVGAWVSGVVLLLSAVTAWALPLGK